MSVCYRVGLRGLVKRLCPAWITGAVEIQVQSQPPTMSKKEKKERKIHHPPPLNWSHQPKPCKQILGDCISPNPDGPLAADYRLRDLSSHWSVSKKSGKYEVNPHPGPLTTGTRHPAYSNTSRHRAHCSPDKHIPKKKSMCHLNRRKKTTQQQAHELAQSAPLLPPSRGLQSQRKDEC